MADNGQYYISAEIAGVVWDIRPGDNPHDLRGGGRLQGGIGVIADKYAELRALEQGNGGISPRLAIHEVGADSGKPLNSEAGAAVQAALTRRGVRAPRFGL